MASPRVIAYVKSPASPAVVEAACWFARARDAELRLVHLTHTRPTEPVDFWDTPETMSGGETLAREFAIRSTPDGSRHDAEARGVLTDMARRCREMGVAHIRTETSLDSLADNIANRTTADDLIVLGQHLAPRTETGLQLGDIVREGRRAILLVPEMFQDVTRWTLAYDGSPACGEAIRFLAAGHWLRDVPMRLLTVGSAPPLRLHHTDALRRLRDEGYSVESTFADGHADQILASVVSAPSTDVLVLGASSRGARRRLFGGSTIQRLVRETAIPLLIVGRA